MSELSLDGHWKLAVLQDCALPERVPITYDGVVGAGALDATVPGNFELELIRVGELPDPYFGKNVLDMYRLEDRHVFYARQFDFAPACGERPELVFEGVDTVAEIHLNGVLVAKTANMYVQHRVKIAPIIGRNDLVVHIFPACLEARANPVSAGNMTSRYNYPSLGLRKPPHMFGWDIMPRLVSAGIYRSVKLTSRPAETFEQLYLMTLETDAERSTAKLELFYEVDIGRRLVSDYRIELKAACKDSVFVKSDRLWFTSGRLEFDVKNVRLWWPKGYGQPNLYNVAVTLFKDERPVCSQSFRTGIRTIRLHKTDVSTEENFGDFHFELNGRRVFVMGTCWVPLDAYHSRDRERLPAALALLNDINCNMVRCWGGNVYEDSAFFDACDEMGVMVWQDFAMACGIYPVTPAFGETVRAESVQVVRRLRRHPSLALWCGDNECDMFIRLYGAGRDANANEITRKILPEVLYNEDPVRPYLPSSPYYGPSMAGLSDRHLTENHLWGPRDYYKSRFFKDSLCSFASEIGYHGCPPVKSLEKFLSKGKLWPWYDNDEWRIHASSPETEADAPYVYRIELMAKQIKELFGAVPDNLDDFVIAGQISQAEGDKFFIELFRCEQPRRSGLTWWNLIDGWPQFSDAVVDYYYEKKLAYHYIKNAQQPLLLTFAEPHDWKLSLMAVNNAGAPLMFSYTITDFDTGETLLCGSDGCEDQQPKPIAYLPYSQSEKKLYVIEWTCAGEKRRNHYLAGNPPFELKWYKRFVRSVYEY